MEEEMIPGLPEEIAADCLLRLGWAHLAAARGVSRRWRSELDSGPHRRIKKKLALTRPILALSISTTSQRCAGDGTKPAPVAHSPVCRLALVDVDTDSWVSVPGPAEDGLPMFARLAAAGRRVFVVGGWDPSTWATTDGVHVYDVASAAWRRGAPMPGPRRSFFACGADPAGKYVFIAGGHDGDKNALRSAAAYDVESGEWVPMPDMAVDRDEPRGVFVRGKFVVAGGYGTDAQGRFVKSGEAFDVATWAWAAVEENLLEEAACPATMTAAGESGPVYMACAGQLTALDDAGEWRKAAPAPAPGQVEAMAALGDGRVAAVVSQAGTPAVHLLSSGGAWTASEAPAEFAGHVQAACSLEI